MKHRGEVIDLTRIASLRGEEYERCTFTGPAVLVALGKVTVDSSRFWVNERLPAGWPADYGDAWQAAYAAGLPLPQDLPPEAVLVDDCEFVNSHFHDVRVYGPPPRPGRLTRIWLALRRFLTARGTDVERTEGTG